MLYLWDNRTQASLEMTNVFHYILEHLETDMLSEMILQGEPEFDPRATLSVLLNCPCILSRVQVGRGLSSKFFTCEVNKYFAFPNRHSAPRSPTTQKVAAWV